MSSGLCSLLLLASLGVMLASQTHDLQVTFAHLPYTTLRIKTQAGCTNATEDNMVVWINGCPRKEKKTLEVTRGVCQEDGVKVCLPQHNRDASCIAVVGEMDGLEYQAEVNVPPTVMFYDGTVPGSTKWTQEGNSSWLMVDRLEGVPVYRLLLKPVSRNKRDSCPKVTLDGEEDSAGSVTFRAHWHQQVFPGCTYKALFQPWDECWHKLARDMEVGNPLEYAPPPTGENRAISGAPVGMAASLSLAVVLLLLVTLHQARRMVE